MYPPPKKSHICYIFQARIHDESLQYILSDKAIIDLALKVPKEAEEVYGVIKHADLNRDIPNLQSVSSPSPVVIGHINDINLLLCEITDDIDDLFRRIFHRYLVQEKICPLSIYNYALLSELNVKLASLLFPVQNGNKSLVRVNRKTSRELFVQKFSCKAPVYHNCRIYASDGRLLCYCDQRKIDWFVRFVIHYFILLNCFKHYLFLLKYIIGTYEGTWQRLLNTTLLV